MRQNQEYSLQVPPLLWRVCELVVPVISISQKLQVSGF